MHSHGSQTGRVLRYSLVATFLYIGLTLFAGIRANSLSLVSEAGHNLSDFLALLLSWVAVYLQERPATSTKTFGYSRAGVLAAFVNALSLVVISCFLLYEAYERFIQPVVVEPGLMMWVAGVGVVMNGVIAFALHRSSRDVNIRSVFLHEIGDTISTAAVIVGGFAIQTTGKYWIDSALSVAIAVMILWSSFGIIRETLNILLEGTPRGLRLADIAEEMRASPGVLDVHDLHVWSIGSEVHALSCHIQIADIPLSESEIILRDVQCRLEKRFHIHHTTIQFENIVCDVAHGCVMPVGGAHGHSH
ncbi:MAG TPA: cation diffusion facilitator family transporter [Terriglobales bacterium]|nr:cation diffusion facilitator family transporter [Terriglobales bacterium]